ncbi:MAG: ROK family transcriptional regulator [Pseudomonadota bacterium]
MKGARQKADTELVRRQNRSLVLETLRRSGPLASIELGARTGLSAATVSAITNDMLDERLIEPDRNAPDQASPVQRGRPKVRLRLSPDAALILGIELAHNQIRLLLADFGGIVLARKTQPIETAHIDGPDFGSIFCDAVGEFLSEEAIDTARLTLASIACQGSVDAKKGEIIWSPAFQTRNIAVAAPLTERFGVRCIVANDTNAIAHALYREDDSLGDSFAVLYLSSGIGLGLFVNGALVEGSDGSASEFGHMLWKQDGALCRCGRYGCIEAYASDFGIFRSARAELAETDPADIAPSQQDMMKLADQARSGDAIARTAFETAATAIGVGLSSLILLVNPKQILFTGPGTAHFDLLQEPLDRALAHIAGRGTMARMRVLDDERDLVEVGLLSLGYTCLDRDVFARRVSVEDVSARQKLSTV